MINSFSTCTIKDHPPALQEISKKHLLLVFLLLCCSGNPVVAQVRDYLYIGFGVSLAAVMNYRSRTSDLRDLLVIAGMFAILLAVQSIQFSYFPFTTVVGFYLRLLIGYAVVRLVPDFPYIFTIVMYYLAIISLVVYIPCQIGYVFGFDFSAIFPDLLSHTTAKKSILLYTFFEEGQSPRNPGMFWEPGAFAGYLNLALLFLGMIKQQLPRRSYTRYLTVFSIAVLTTMSTAGYVVFFVVILLHIDWRTAITREAAQLRPYIILFAVPLFITMCILGYSQLDFMHEKINKQVENVQSSQEGWHRTRVGSIVLDWEYIKRRPVAGWGLSTKTRFALHPWLMASKGGGMGNGMSDFTAKFGITGMLIYMIALFRGMLSLANHNVWKGLFGVSIVMLVLQGEAFLNFPLFVGLMFLCPSTQPKVISKYYSEHSYVGCFGSPQLH